MRRPGRVFLTTPAAMICLGAEHDVLRLNIAPERVSHMESFAIYFPMVLRDEAVMRLHRGEWALSVRIEAPYRPPEGDRFR